MNKEIIVDIQGFLTSCPQFGRGRVQLSFIECEQCEYHKWIEEVWPGKDGEPVIVKAAEMTDETFVNSDNVDTGKHRLYDRMCGLPTRERAIMLIKFTSNTEE